MYCMETITKTNVAHPFERTLGIGPYRFVGMFTISLAAGAMGRPYYDASLVHKNFVRGAGTCAHCGHAILNVCQVMIGNGEVYGIGTDCIEKASMPVIELTKVQKAVKAHQKALRDARNEKKRETMRIANKALGDAARIELQALIDFGTLVAFAHPNEYMAQKGMTLNDYALWAMSQSSDTGIVSALTKIKAAGGQ